MGNRSGGIAFALLLLAAVVMAGERWWRSHWDISAASTNLDVPGLDVAELRARGITRTVMGTLDVPTGQLVVTDPLMLPDREPLTRSVSPGRYEIALYEAEGRIAMASLTISSADVVGWELGLVPGQSMSELAKDEYFGFGVGAGLGSFMDVQAAQAMARRDDMERLKAGGGHYDYYNDVLNAELGEADFIFHKPLPDEEGNIAIFSSGWGDGSYPAIWGIDAAGEPASLVIDFHVLEDGRIPE